MNRSTKETSTQRKASRQGSVRLERKTYDIAAEIERLITTDEFIEDQYDALVESLDELSSVTGVDITHPKLVRAAYLLMYKEWREGSSRVPDEVAERAFRRVQEATDPIGTAIRRCEREFVSQQLRELHGGADEPLDYSEWIYDPDAGTVRRESTEERLARGRAWMRVKTRKKGLELVGFEDGEGGEDVADDDDEIDEQPANVVDFSCWAQSHPRPIRTPLFSHDPNTGGSANG